MEHTVKENMPPQKDVLTLETAMNRTNNWREAVKKYFGNDIDMVPHGFVIPLADILELAKNYEAYDIAGVRAYFTLDQIEKPGQPLTNQISALLVPVFLDTESSTAHKPSVFRDIIIPVPGLNDGGKETYSIYDVTQPCPPICDNESELM
jgi:hypothetical protein